MGAKAPVQNPENEGQPSAEQLEEQKQKLEAANKEWEDRCQKRDAFMKTVFENPATWILEEKILMKYEVRNIPLSFLSVLDGNFTFFPYLNRAILRSHD